MSQTTLKWLRFATPGLVILLFFSMLGQVTHLWSMPGLDKVKDALPSLSVIIPAGVYYLTPFRRWANQRYFGSVSENLRVYMVRISGLCDEPSVYTWRALRGIFFHFVDNDKSLSSKASLAYFNGFIWTTCADVRVIGLSYIFITGILAWQGIEGAIACLALFAIFVGVSVFGSGVATRRHKTIGDEQLEILELYHRDELRKTLEEIRDRARSTSHK